MAQIDFGKQFSALIHANPIDYSVCGVITSNGMIYPLGSDTKVLGTIFELLVRPLIIQIASNNSLLFREPESQNYYPDFTIYESNSDQRKIAIDIKTTYVDNINDKFSFTLGGYTSFLRGKGDKNILYPFSEYEDHWVICFVYERVAQRRGNYNTYTVNQLPDIPLPYNNVRFFVRRKWEIAGDSAGSGNTTNIGSVRGTLSDFINKQPLFFCEAEFLNYWRNYEKNLSDRNGKFRNITEYRDWMLAQGLNP
jgi:hypothetical protein